MNIRKALTGALLTLTCATGASAAEPDEAIRETLATCATCHGEAGAKPLPGLPVLAGQHFYYLYVQLKDFKAGRRADPVMGAIAGQFEKSQMKALAQYFSEQEWPRSAERSDPTLTVKGEMGIAAGQCVACHLGSFEGDSRVPRVAGQSMAYLRKTMTDFKNKTRLNSPAKGSLMESFSDEDITAMADFLGGY